MSQTGSSAGCGKRRGNTPPFSQSRSATSCGIEAAMYSCTELSNDVVGLTSTDSVSVVVVVVVVVNVADVVGSTSRAPISAAAFKSTTVEFVVANSSSASIIGGEMLSDVVCISDDDDDDDESSDGTIEIAAKADSDALTFKKPANFAANFRAQLFAAAATSSSTTATTKSTVRVPTTTNASATNDALWIDKFGVERASELAVHASKVAQVRAFLEQSTGRLLVLTGAPGCGKSATVRVLARELSVLLCEWLPDALVKKLTLAGDDPEGDDGVLGPLTRWLREHASFSPLGQETRRKLLLIDELPYLHGERERGEFRALLERFARTSRYPLALVLSDSVALRTRDLLPSLLDRPTLLQCIAFNATPPTLMRKALVRVLQLAHVTLADERVADVIEQCQGDVRHAVNTLQFVAVGAPTAAAAAAAVVAAGASPNGAGSATSKPTRTAKKRSASESVAAIKRVSANDAADARKPFVLTLGRNETVSLFRALGKVLIGKRDEAADNADNDAELMPPPPPPKTSRVASSVAAAVTAATSKSRPMGVMFVDGNARRHVPNSDGRPPLSFDPEELLLATNMDASMFSLFLFENYVPYFDSALAEERSVAAVAAAAEWLSLGAHIGAAWDTTETAQQYAGAVAVRGLLHENWFPDPATAPPARSAFRPQHRPHWLHVRALQHMGALALRSAAVSPTAAPLSTPTQMLGAADVALDRAPWLHRIVAYLPMQRGPVAKGLVVPPHVRALCRALCDLNSARNNKPALQQNELADAADAADDDENNTASATTATTDTSNDQAMQTFEQWSGVARAKTSAAAAANGDAPLSAEETQAQIALLALDPIQE